MQHISLLPCNWRPITLCALLLASKVWPDNTPTNEEFCHVYPQFDKDGFNDLESTFVTDIQWNVLINSSTYAKYYFALRAIGEQVDFRRKYNALVHVRPEKSKSIEVRIEKRFHD
ncbi:cyclin-y-like protein [Blastocystis sp. subtype 4]|uniref:cyclin-y-like protein n=1 Tax=Blastocystis sp. subtype 4 TaxID=944170 RepID=UPI000711CAB6|nr:cyclin-y-like protein [Blastocystis sp. subtype 4]KNB42446.1 cyclin-y-like protein [Blastocystis sp. subtype 4]|eukprot:XP_014525889.1 cyclin-y-like protein [Blastocystis sp. subtype 4]